MSGDRSHEQLAGELRQHVVGSGVLDGQLREGALSAGGGGKDLAEPYGSLAGQVASASYAVTDVQVAAVRAAAGSEKVAFELVMAASIGAGLRRWDAAMRAIEEATNATS